MTKEEMQGVVILVGFTAFVIGFRSGWRTGKNDLLQGIQSAQRIITKEQ